MKRFEERTEEDGGPMDVEQEDVSEPEVRAWSELDGWTKEAAF